MTVAITLALALLTWYSVRQGGGWIASTILIGACAHGRRIALKIDRFLREGIVELLEEESDEAFLNQLKVFDPSETVAIPGGVERMPVKHEQPLERRKDFREVDKGFTVEEAVAEANRCLRCYRVVMYARKKET